MTTLALVPLQIELDPLVRALEAAGRRARQVSLGRSVAWEIEDLDVVLVLSGHGKVQTAVLAQHALSHLKGCSQVLCLGGAGALAPIPAGGVVAGTSTIEHDYTLRFVERPSPAFDGDPGLLERLRDHATREPAPALHFGVIASGDEDVIDAERARELAARTGALCVAWEGAGAARAAAFNGLPFLELRVVTDAADADAPNDYRATVESGMAGVAGLLPILATGAAG